MVFLIVACGMRVKTDRNRSGTRGAASGWRAAAAWRAPHHHGRFASAGQPRRRRSDSQVNRIDFRKPMTRSPVVLRTKRAKKVNFAGAGY